MGAERPAGRAVAVLTFALFFPLAMTWFYFVAMHHEGGAESNLGLQVAYYAGKAIQFLFPLAYVAAFESFRPRRPSAAGLVPGLAFGLAVGAAILLAYFLKLRGSPQLAHTPEQLFRRLQEFQLASPAGFVAVGVFYSLIHSFLEEYYWRWFVFGQLRRYLPPAGAIVVSSVGFALHHVVILYVYLPGQFWLLALPFAAAVAVGGAYWARLYEKTGSLLGPWLSHLLIDAALMIVGYAMLAPYWAYYPGREVDHRPARSASKGETTSLLALRAGCETLLPDE